jgi:hypothetical protein
MLHLRSVFTTRRRVAVLIAAAASFAGAGVALAFYTTSGSGSGSATAATPQAVSVVAFAGGDAPSSTLQPGGTADVILRLSNPNAYAVTLVAATGNGSITPDSGHSGCTTTGVSFTDQTGLSISIPSGSSLVHVPGAAKMDTTSSSGCQGATFSIPITLTVHK